MLVTPSAIELIGHDPVLSEYAPFPVAPDLSTVENCKRVVRDRADLFILIVGGKRGSLDPKTQKSVVNTEYREAKLKKLDCFIFVDRQIWDLRFIYRKNKDADFSPTVDYPAVFEFLDELESDNKWIFPFQRTEEIIATIKTQLSIRFSDLLVRTRTNRISIPTEFIGESEEIIRIVIDREDCWEYQLVYELLKDRMARIDDKFADISGGFVLRKTRFVSANDTMEKIRDLLSDIMAIMSALNKVLQEQITPGFGLPGIPGDAFQIKKGCDNLYELLLALYEWELDIRAIRTDEFFANLLRTMYGWSDDLLSGFRQLPKELYTLISTPNLSGNHSITLEVKTPAGLTEFMSELEMLTRNIENS
jgi:Domain of unknown function (DUF4062)